MLGTYFLERDRGGKQVILPHLLTLRQGGQMNSKMIVAVAAVVILSIIVCNIPESEADVVSVDTLEELNSAISGASSAMEIDLEADITNVATVITIEDGKTITLDLNGHKISFVRSGNVDPRFYCLGSLTIKDSTAEELPVVDTSGYSVTYKSGTIDSDTVAIYVEEGGNLTLESGTVKGTYNAINVYGDITTTDDSVVTTFVMNGGHVHGTQYGVVVFGDCATFEFNNGVVESDEDGAISGNGTINEKRDNGGVSIVMNGGYAIANYDTGGAAYKEGKISCGIYMPNYGTVEVNGGTIYAENGVGILMRAGHLDVKGGTIISTDSEVGNLEQSVTGIVGDSGVKLETASLIIDETADYIGAETQYGTFGASIYSGTFEADNKSMIVMESTDSEGTNSVVEIRGGTFEKAFPSSYVVSGYEVSGNQVVVSGGDPPVKIGEIGFTSLKDAWMTATADTTIQLQRDITVTEELVVSLGQTIELDLNGCDITLEGNGSFLVSKGTLDITNTSETEAQISSEGTTVTVIGGSNAKQQESNVIVGVGVSIIGNAAISVDDNSNNDYGVSITVNGTVSSTDGDALVVDDGVDRSIGRTLQITLSQTGEVTSSNGTGINNGGYAKINIHGSVSGTTAIDSKNGIMNVYDGAFVAGTVYGIIVYEAFAGNFNTVNVQGGTISGATVAFLQKDSAGSLSLSITGGDFDGNITAESKTKFISGGTFSVQTDESYLADNYGFIQVGDSYIVEAINKNVFAVNGILYDTLAEAIAAAGEDGTVVLQKDTTLSSLYIDEDGITLDLDGYTIVITGDRTEAAVTFFGTGITIRDGTISDERSSNGITTMSIGVQQEITLTNVNMIFANALDDNDTETNPSNIGVIVNCGTLNIDGITTISAITSESSTFRSVGVILVGNDIDGSVELNMSGSSSIKTGLFGISGDGSEGRGGTTINISGSASVVASNGWGVYHPQKGVIEIGGNASISGLTGIEIRSGTLVIDSGSVTSTATGFNEEVNGNGGGPTINSGAAVAVSQHTTDLPISVTINNGTLTGIKALYEVDLQNESVSNIAISVKGGVFDGSVSSENVTQFISGGSFTKAPDAACIAQDYELVGDTESGYFVRASPTIDESEDGTVSVKVPSTGGSATLDSKTVLEAIQKIEENTGADDKAMNVNIGEAEGVTIPSDSLSDIAKKEITLTVSNSTGSVTIDPVTAGSIAGDESSPMIEIIVKPIDSGDLGAPQIPAVGDNPVFELSIKVDGMPVQNFNEAVTVTLVVPNSFDNPTILTVYYVDDQGLIEDMRAELVDGSLIFETHHFSEYFIAEKGLIPDSEPEPDNEFPFPGWNDDDDYVPPIIPVQSEDSGEDDTTTIVACAAAAVVAALIAAYLIIDRRQ